MKKSKWLTFLKKKFTKYLYAFEPSLKNMFIIFTMKRCFLAVLSILFYTIISFLGCSSGDNIPADQIKPTPNLEQEENGTTPANDDSYFFLIIKDMNQNLSTKTVIYEDNNQKHYVLAEELDLFQFLN